MTVASPSLPPYRVTSTSVFASGGLSSHVEVRRMSASVYTPAPAASAAPPTTPERIRNFRRVRLSTGTSSGDGVLGAGEPEGEHGARVLRGGEDRAGPVGERVDHEQVRDGVGLGRLRYGVEPREHRRRRVLGDERGRAQPG